jgi:predicted TIM-barrel fold metal-dependent hydrolase
MSTAGTGTSPRPIILPARQDWLDRRSEEILEPDLPIVDPHHHLWDRPGPIGRYLLDELLADLNSGHRIVATVFAQCGSMYRADGPEALRPVGETEFVNGIAAMSASGRYGPTHVCAGIVGYADLTLGDRVQEVLEAHLRAGGGRFRGVRQTWLRDPAAHAYYGQPPGTMFDHPPGLLADLGFRAGFARLAPLGLSFDAALAHPHISELTALARAFPDTGIVLDHVGFPLGIGAYAGRREAVFADWSAGIRELATCPNVAVKLGGLGMTMIGFAFHEEPEPPSSERLATAWRPYMESCIEAFGADRCMFESNFPVDKASCSYAVFWNACKRLADGASATEKQALFSGSAARFYRLALPGDA